MTRLGCGGFFIANLLLNVIVKELCKSVDTRYDKNSVAPFLLAHSLCANANIDG